MSQLPRAVHCVGIGMIADSNHGFKMTGVGKLVARLLMGDDVPELKPFALGRYAAGRTFGASGSHFPWV
jgi:hypothetical protein